MNTMYGNIVDKCRTKHGPHGNCHSPSGTQHKANQKNSTESYIHLKKKKKVYGTKTLLHVRAHGEQSQTVHMHFKIGG